MNVSLIRCVKFGKRRVHLAQMHMYCVHVRNFHARGLKNFGKQKHHGVVERMWELAQRNMNSTITLPGKQTQVTISVLILLPVPSL